MQPLRELAQQAWADEQRQREQNNAECRKSLESRVWKEFKNTFDCEPGRMDGAEVFVDQMHLRRTEECYNKHWWELLGVCPACGGQEWSAPIYDIEGLGQMLEGFTPCQEHQQKCLPSLSSTLIPTPVETDLLRVLRRWKEGVVYFIEEEED